MNKGANLFSFMGKPMNSFNYYVSKGVLILSFLVLTITSCQREPSIYTFDTTSWQGDTNGCNGDRLNQLSILIDEQKELLGWPEAKITGYLGAPDYHELYVRNQKFLIYYIEPTLACGTEGKENPLRLYVRMDALGQSKEISLKNN
jgi:hypothetical protein